MKLKKFASTLLCMSIAAIAAIALSGCTNDEVSSPNLETTTTASIAEASTNETEVLSRSYETEPTETEPTETTPQAQSETTTEAEETVPEETDALPQTEETELTETTPQETAQTTAAPAITEAAPTQTTTFKAEETTVTEAAVEKLSVEKDGSYTTPEDVAEYIHTFGTLPKNFITKSDAKALGWDSSKGNLWDVAEGKSIGGDYFGNYEGLLPKADGRKYTECDVNYSGGYRGSERIIFSNDGLIFYTNDHYKTFTQLY